MNENEKLENLEECKKEYKNNAVFATFFAIVMTLLTILCWYAILNGESQPGIIVAMVVMIVICTTIFVLTFGRMRDNRGDIKWMSNPEMCLISEMMEIIESATVLADLNLQATERDLKVWSSSPDGFAEYIEYFSSIVFPRVKQAAQFFEGMPKLKITDVM